MVRKKKKYNIVRDKPDYNIDLLQKINIFLRYEILEGEADIHGKIRRLVLVLMREHVNEKGVKKLQRGI